MDYYIGIDIGTTSTKAVAFDIYGEMIAMHSIGYPLYHSQPEWSELKPKEILDAVIDCLHKIALTLSEDNPVLISFDALMHSIIAVDENENLLTDCMIWADNRAAKVAADLNKMNGKAIYQQTGVPVHAMSPLSKLLWLKENEPAIYTGSKKFIGIKEFIFHQLFGVYVVDTGIASTTGLLDIHTLKWSKKILDLIGVKEEQLSILVDPEYRLSLKNNMEPKLEKFKDTAFIIGGSDGGFANLGSGATAAGSMAVTIGTSGAVRMLSQQVYTDAQSRTFCYFVNGKDYIIGGASNNGAIATQWLKENIFEATTSMDELLSLSEKIEPGCGGLLFLPYLLGERAPLWDAKAKAIFFGLDVTHTKAHLIRAVMEGVLFNLYAIANVLSAYKKPTIIYASGGFTKNNHWVQMLADIFNMQVVVHESEESSALGAVMVGLKSLNITPRFKQKIGRYFMPEDANRQVYAQSFKKFQRISKFIKKEHG